MNGKKEEGMRPKNRYTELFMGICIFIAGVMLWLSSMGIIDAKVIWANILMVCGIILTAKEAFFSFRE
jgi:hypothetical protein